MFSHIVVFWTKPELPNAADDLLEGIEKLLRPIPGVLHFHAGKMVGSTRPVVEQSYQVALNLTFADKQGHDDYQVHPMHVQFVNEVFKKNCQKVVIYDFE
ncbi:MAG: Dabb family protein [Limisphaerales bacterium]